MITSLVRSATRLLAPALLLAALAGLPATAQDRPDLLDVPSQSFALVRSDGVDYNSIWIDEVTVSPSGGGATRRESFRVSHEFPGVDTLAFRIYEPDKVMRSSTSAKLGQRDRLFVRLLLPAPPSPYNTFSTYGVVTGCKGTVQVKQYDTQNVSYKFSCASADDVMNQLGVPAGLRPTFLALFGPKFAVKNKGVIP
jgi:hypothetical protein